MATEIAKPTLPVTLEDEITAPPGSGKGLRTFDSLSHPSFRWFFMSMLGWFASMQMQMLVRGVIVYELTGSYAALGLVSLANAIPGLFLSLPGGVLADRMNKKRIVQSGQLSNTVVAVALAALMLSDLLVFWHLLACAVIQGSINALIMPARQSLIAEVVPEAQLMNAVSLNTAAMNVMRLVAPTFGGFLLAATGPGWVYLTMGGLYFSGALFLSPVRLTAPGAGAASGHHGHKAGGLSDMIEGCRYMWRDKTVLIILMMSLMIVLFSMPYQQMLPGFAKDVLGAGAGRLGLLMSVTGIGSLAGSLVIASLPPRRRGSILLWSSLVLGVSLLLFSASSWYWVTIVIMLGVGVGQAGRMSLSSVLLQSYTEPEYRGRVMSVYMLEFSLTAFGTFAVGMLASTLGVQLAIGATAVGLVVLSIGALIFSPRMRKLD